MASRYGPGVLPGYYGGDPGADITEAIGSYLELKRQQRFDDLAAKGQEVDLYRGGFRPEAPIPAAPDLGDIPLPSATDVAASVGQRGARGTLTLPEDFQPDPFRAGEPEGAMGPADEAAMMLEQRRRQAAGDPAVPAKRTGPVPGSIAREMGTQFFKLANGGYFVPGASEQDRRITEERGYRDRVRGEENQREDELIAGARSYESRVRGKENARADERARMELAARQAQAEADREFEERMSGRRFGQERSLIRERGEQERTTVKTRAELEGRSGEADPAWEERRSAAVALLGKPLTPLQQDIVGALADGETPDRILGYLQDQGVDAETLTAARLYLSAGRMGYRGTQTTTRPPSGQF